MQSQETVAVLGIGDMGAPMAANLARAGFDVAAFDAEPGRARRPGLRATASIDEACEGAGLVVSLVRTLPQTEEVLAQVGRAAARGTVVIVMSTIDPTSMRRLAESLEGSGLLVLDGPVSGGTQGAEAGTLTVMAGGRADVLRRARPALEAMAGSVFHVGENPGDGQAMKLANQLSLCVSMQGAYEALKLAASYGLPPSQVLPVLGVSTGMSWVTEHWDTVLGWWEGNPGGGALDIVYKDVRSLLRDAADRQQSYPVTAVAFNLLRERW